MQTANEIIKKLDLKPLPEEGGYYKETYKSTAIAPARVLGVDADGDRSLATAIYYLLVPKSFSAIHRVKSDEIFHFYSGDPVEMIQIDPDGKLKKITLGSDILNGETPQVVVPAGSWQGSRLKPGGNWALLGTTVSPGFEFEDFELGDREKMSQLFPQHQNEVMQFTRGLEERTH